MNDTVSNGGKLVAGARMILSGLEGHPGIDEASVTELIESCKLAAQLKGIYPPIELLGAVLISETLEQWREFRESKSNAR